MKNSSVKLGYQFNDLSTKSIHKLIQNYQVFVANYFQLNINYGAEHGDPMDFHAFTVVNSMQKDGKIFLDYVPTFTKKQSQYQAVLRVVIDPEDQPTFK